MNDNNRTFLIIYLSLVLCILLGYVGGYLDSRELVKECHTAITDCEKDLNFCYGQNQYSEVIPLYKELLPNGSLSVEIYTGLED